MSVAALSLPRLERYALAAMLDLASREEGDRPTSDALADAIDAPRPMLAKVLRRLVVAGLVVSARGHHGGYSLGRLPEHILLAEVLSAVEDERDEHSDEMDCALGVRACNPKHPCRLHDCWVKATHELRELLFATTLHEVAHGGCRQT